MNKYKLSIILISLLVTITTAGQTYSSLWKQEKSAGDKDQPRTQLKVLSQIASKAETEKAYGHLLKATVKSVNVWGGISNDSIKPAIERLEAKERNTNDIVLRSVYDAAIGRLYGMWSNILDDGEKLAKQYNERAMERPDKLASAKATGYEPFVEEGANSSSLFNDDLLNVIAYETKLFDVAHAFYSLAGNRRATCIMALEMLKQKDMPSERKDLKKSPFIQALDSLISEYQDLDVAGEVSVERYNLMDYCTGVTVEDRIHYIHYALEKWGAWQRMGELRNAERQLTQPMFRVRMEKGLITPNTEQTVRLEDLRNINSLTMNVYSTKLDGDTDINPENVKEYKQLKPQLTLLPELSQTRVFRGLPEYQQFNDSIVIAGLPVGVYMIEFVSSPSFETQRGLYRVSDVFAISQPMPDGQTRYVVVNATTGQPIAGAKIRLSTGRYSHTPQAVTLTADTKGESTYKADKAHRNMSVYAYTDTDRASSNGSIYGSFYYNGTKRHQERTRTFTDRSIYRPGQTVHASAIVYETDDNINNKAVEGKQVKAILRDANYQQVEEKTLTTDKYGKCSTDFTLPTGKLTGRYNVTINNSSASISVEEYKRPTFRVEFPNVSEKYQNGDTLMVRGKAVSYAGVPVQGATVKYTVTRQPAYWWMNTWRGGYMTSDGSTVMREGEAVTDSEGTFVVEMPMQLPDLPTTARSFYNFVATADVTDAAGESHHGELNIPLGTHPATLSSSLQPQVLADSTRHITFNLRNAAGYDVKTDVRFRFDNRGEWLQTRTIEPFALANKFTSGKHTLTALCEGDTLRQEFIAFSLDDKKPCTETDDWFFCSSESFQQDGSPVTVQVGSSAKDMHIVYSVFSGDKVLDSGAYDMSDAVTNIKLRYKEEYGDGLLLTFAWVKNGKCYTHNATIKRPLPDTKLKMEWTSFRDRLTPGQKEEWSLKITKPDGKPANASLIATLYDQSLDQIKEHKWSFSPQAWLRTPTTEWRCFTLNGINRTSAMGRSWLQSKALDLSHFTDEAFSTFHDEILLAKHTLVQPETRMGVMSVQEASGMAKKQMAMATLDAEVSEDAATFNSVEEPKEEASAMTDQVRENLNETAFFYPSLQTDAEGNVIMKFTLPESLTTWRFIGLANTIDMMYGQLTGEAVAQKPIMVQPNVPRFIRTGDKAQIATRISNTTETTVTGTARMTLTDPETENTVYTKEIAFTAEAGKTATVTFDYQPDGQLSLLVCKITASGKDFSDGEQHYLPILPDCERVTVTAPFTQNEPGVKTIDITKLFPKDTEKNKLTIEYTNNPVWLVVQSLPYIATPSDDNAISQASALYANTIGQKLANSSPKIKQTFAQWKMEQADGTSLTSALARNEELKDIALDETPWLNDADRETEQKVRMTDFFDENTMQNRLSTAASKLGKLQNDDGSWSWWKGMDGSIHITVEVAQILARSNAFAGEQAASKQMFDRAMTFMDKQIVKKVNDMKSEERKGHRQSFPGMNALRYMYINALSGRTPSSEARTAQQYLLELLKKETKNQSIYEKALTAIVFSKTSNLSLGKEYAQSLKEYLVNSEEMGSYYDTRKATYSWYDYKIPSHVAAMEAMTVISSEYTKTIDEMRRWLLQEKRTQAWDTPINTVNAVYAFLTNNIQSLTSLEQASLAIDGETIDTPKATAGIGYVKTAINQPTGNTFTATKTSTGTSWGALYAQFTQKTSDIESSNSAISVKREIITDKKELKVGDRIKVRITIEAKRDLDFVQVIDHRAACTEPVNQLSGYRNGSYCSPKDNTTNYYFNQMAKGRKAVIETEYYIDRAGDYETGTCTAGCSYAPEYRATAKSLRLRVDNKE